MSQDATSQPEVGERGRERRSSLWFDAPGRGALVHRGMLLALGLGPEATQGRPIIGIGSSASELNPCNAHLGRVAEAVARGVWQAGGVPLIFPTMSLGEAMIRPTAMLYRNLMSMEVEETLRANPLDGAVLLSGCDKTTPAMLMALASVDLPGMVITGGPKLNGKYRGEDLGSGTSLWRFEREMRAECLNLDDYDVADFGTNRSEGHCNTMGTASSMASIVEALGMQPSGMSSYPAADKRRYALAQSAGSRAVAMVAEGLTPSRILTEDAFANAVHVNAAIGGSTNVIVHLLAIAGRAGVDLSLDEIDRLTSEVPLLVNLMPSGRYLMEDYCYAGGLPAVIHELGDLIRQDALTVSGRTIGEEVATAEVWNRDVIHTRESPCKPAGTGTAVLRGNLCPGGAVIKQSAASPELLRHRGQALVFDSPEAYHAVADRDDLPVEASTVLVVRNAGPIGYPGMPEVGNVPIPNKLARAGITDMVRISDGRMSGTGFGTVVLHVAPEAAVGGPLGLVRTGDWICLDVPARTLTLEVDDAELDRRRAAWSPPQLGPSAESGYTWLFRQHVLQADRGVDFDFLVGRRGSAVARDSH
jgi:dihydroxy-acid dehydratase